MNTQNLLNKIETSLKKQLNNWIQREGYVSYNDIKKSCEDRSFGKYYRITTAERRLREIMLVSPVKEGGAVVGYQWIEPPKMLPEFKREQVKMFKIPISL